MTKRPVLTAVKLFAVHESLKNVSPTSEKENERIRGLQLGASITQKKFRIDHRSLTPAYLLFK
jgi:hypothetical protein